MRTLKAGEPKLPIPEPPGHLSERARELFSQVVPERIVTPRKVALLVVALESLDRAEAARLQVERDGMLLSVDRGKMPHAHPLLKVEKDSRALFARVWGELGLNWPEQTSDRHPYGLS